MFVTFVRGILALLVVALLLLAPASPARAAIVTLDFTGTYDTNGDTIFGLSGLAVPFFYSLTYDTSLDTNTAFGAVGTMPDGTVPLLDNFYGYSTSGIIASTLTFGSERWSTSIQFPRVLGGGLSADFFLNAELGAGTPTRAWIFFVGGRGEVALGGIVRGATGVSYTPESYVKDGSFIKGAGPMTISVRDAAPTPVPEPSSMLLLGAGLIGTASRLRRRFSRQR